MVALDPVGGARGPETLRGHAVLVIPDYLPPPVGAVLVGPARTLVARHREATSPSVITDTV